MKAKGLVWRITFIGPVREADDGGSWSHFTGPGGNVYEITTPAPARPRA